MQTTINKNPLLSNGEELAISLFHSSYQPMLFLHSSLISSERSISNSSFRKLGATVFFHTRTGDTSIKLKFASIEDAELAAKAFLGFGVSETNEYPHLDPQRSSNFVVAKTCSGADLKFADFDGRIGFFVLPSIEVTFNMDTSGVSLDSPFPSVEGIALSVRSHSEAGLSSYINVVGLDSSFFFAIESYYKKLRYPMHRMTKLSDEAIRQLIGD